MEESVLYLWYMSETREIALGHMTRFPAKSTPFRDLAAGMDLAVRFENEYVRENLGKVTVENVEKDSVTLSYRSQSITLHKGDRWTSEKYRVPSSYLPEYVGIEVELS